MLIVDSRLSEVDKISYGLLLVLLSSVRREHDLLGRKPLMAIQTQTT